MGRAHQPSRLTVRNASIQHRILNQNRKSQHVMHGESSDSFRESRNRSSEIIKDASAEPENGGLSTERQHASTGPRVQTQRHSSISARFQALLNHAGGELNAGASFQTQRPRKTKYQSNKSARYSIFLAHTGEQMTSPESLRTHYPETKHHEDHDASMTPVPVWRHDKKSARSQSFLSLVDGDASHRPESHHLGIAQRRELATVGALAAHSELPDFPSHGLKLPSKGAFVATRKGEELAGRQTPIDPRAAPLLVPAPAPLLEPATTLAPAASSGEGWGSFLISLLIIIAVVALCFVGLFHVSTRKRLSGMYDKLTGTAANSSPADDGTVTRTTSRKRSMRRSQAGGTRSTDMGFWARSDSYRERRAGSKQTAEFAYEDGTRSVDLGSRSPRGNLGRTGSKEVPAASKQRTNFVPPDSHQERQEHGTPRADIGSRSPRTAMSGTGSYRELRRQKTEFGFTDSRQERQESDTQSVDLGARSSMGRTGSYRERRAAIRAAGLRGNSPPPTGSQRENRMGFFTQTESIPSIGSGRSYRERQSGATQSADLSSRMGRNTPSKSRRPSASPTPENVKTPRARPLNMPELDGEAVPTAGEVAPQCEDEGVALEV